MTDAHLLRKSFDLIGPQKETFTRLFYVRLFELYPFLRPLFVQDMYIQERSLAATLHMIVQATEQHEDLSLTLYKLGKRHETYGVLPEHYPLLKIVLLETFSNMLGEQFTPEMRQSWDETYERISQEMQRSVED